MLRAIAKLVEAATRQPDNLEELRQLEKQVRRSLTRLQTTLERAK